MEYKVGVISGDGIGPEIVAEAKKVLDKIADKYGHSFNYTDILMGGCSIDATGVPLTDEAIETALDSNKETLGYVITVTAKDGSQGSITFSVGIKNDGTVNGYSITSISETPGLGMKAEEADFYKQFENKKVDKFDVVKATPSKDDEIEAITGSTITSKAMANGCNAAITYFQNKLQGGAN